MVDTPRLRPTGPLVEPFTRIEHAVGEPIEVLLMSKPGNKNHSLSVSTMGHDGLPGFPRVGRMPVASISWSQTTGVIAGVLVESPYQRRGIASALLDLAKLTNLKPEPVHSDVRTPDGAAWIESLGSVLAGIDRLKSEDGKRRLSLREVERKCREVVDAVGREHGVDLSKVEIVLDVDYLPAMVDARYEAEGRNRWTTQSRILVSTYLTDDLRDPTTGIQGFRQIAHEATHAASDQLFIYEGHTQQFEEAATEILSVWHWAHEGQPFGSADAFREDGRWIDGARALVHRANYHEWIGPVLRRAASKVGWQPSTMVAYISATHRNHAAVLDFMMDNDPEFPPPPGVKADGESLLLWLITEGIRRGASLGGGRAWSQKVAWKPGDVEGWITEVIDQQYPDRGRGACRIVSEVVRDEAGLPNVNGVYWSGGSLEDAIEAGTIYDHWWNVKPNGDIFDGTGGQFHPSGDTIRRVPRGSAEHEHYIDYRTLYDDYPFAVAEAAEEIAQYARPRFGAANGGEVPADVSIRRNRVGNIDTDRLSRRREWLRSLIKDRPGTLENRIDFVWKAAELHAIENELERRGELPDERITLRSSLDDGEREVSPVSDLLYRMDTDERGGWVVADDPLRPDHDSEVASLSWLYDGDKGVVQGVWVLPPYQRQGVATKLLTMARDEVDYPIEHDTSLSDDGRAWAQHVGAAGVTYEVVEDLPPPAPMGSAEIRAYVGGTMVGKALLNSQFWPSGSYRAWSVWNIFVEPEHQRQGIARGMMEALHRKYPKDKILHQGFASEEGAAFAESLPPSWNRVKGWDDSDYRRPRSAALKVEPERFWRVHPAGRGWDDATSTQFHPQPGEGTREGFSCFSNPWVLWAYVMLTWNGMVGPSDRVVGFEGRRVGTGHDGEDLAIPTTSGYLSYTWDDFCDELLTTPLPASPAPVKANWAALVGPWRSSDAHRTVKHVIEHTTPQGRIVHAVASRIGQPGYLDREDFEALWAKVVEAIRNAPAPTADQVKRNLDAMKNSGRNGGDFRGNSYDRRRRTQRLLDHFGDGTHVGCAYCGKILDADTLSADKIITGRDGGRYVFANLLPSCQDCNARRGDARIAVPPADPRTAASGVRIMDPECIGWSGGQTDLVIYAFANDQVVGNLHYAVYQGEIHVAGIEVLPEYRRQGIATEMWAKMLAAHPHMKVNPGHFTDDGKAWWASMGPGKLGALRFGAGFHGSWLEPYYIRFGLIPRGERSINHITGEREDGVSVYRMATDGRPIDPDPLWFEEGGSGQDSYQAISDRILETRRGGSPAFVVTGTERTTTGHDGEPLLRNVRVVAEWDPREPLAWRDTDWEAEWAEWGKPSTHFGVRAVANSERTYYHGTQADLPIGTILIPAGERGGSNYDHLYSNPGEEWRGEWVWITDDPEDAKRWSRIGPGGTFVPDSGHVYEVEPEGEVVNGCRAPRARIVRKVAGFNGMADEIHEDLLDLDLPAVARDGDCLPVSGQIHACLTEHGWDAHVVYVSGYGDFQGQRVLLWMHVVVLVDGRWVVDATATQYDRSLPPLIIEPPERYKERMARATGAIEVDITTPSGRTAALEVAYTEPGKYGRRDHITMEERGTVPIEVVKHMRGQNGEIPGQHRNKHGEVWEEFKRDLSENGMHYGIFICIEVGEPVRIWEGNHRRDAAVELGWDEIPVQVRYFGHAERDGTLLERWERGDLNRALRSEASVGDYGGTHQPSADGPPVYDLLSEESDWSLPADIYDKPQWYTGYAQFLPETMATLKRVRGNPSAKVRIYRALPPGHTSIETGNWVSLSLAYAREHAMNESDPSKDWPVIYADVPASTVRHAGDDLMEYGYWGPDIGAKTASHTAGKTTTLKPLPMGPGIFYRLQGGRPFDPGNASSTPLVSHEDMPSVGKEWADKYLVTKPGYSAFANPEHVRQYVEEMDWDKGKVVAFRGTIVGVGLDDEPLVQPQGGPIETIEWDDFEGRIEVTPDATHYPRWDSAEDGGGWDFEVPGQGPRWFTLGVRMGAVKREAAIALPPLHDTLYPAVFDGLKVRPEVKARLIQIVNDAMPEGTEGQVRLWLAGSGASFNWDEEGDLDVQVWVALATPAGTTRAVREVLSPLHGKPLSDFGIDGSMQVQFYVHAGDGTPEDALQSKPYALYDFDTDTWAVMPIPQTPAMYAERFERAQGPASTYADQADDALGRLDRAEQSIEFAKATGLDYAGYADEAAIARQQIMDLYARIKDGRAQAYGPGGEGINDVRDTIVKVLEAWGVWQRLKALAEAEPVLAA